MSRGAPYFKIRHLNFVLFKKKPLKTSIMLLKKNLLLHNETVDSL